MFVFTNVEAAWLVSFHESYSEVHGPSAAISSVVHESTKYKGIKQNLNPFYSLASYAFWCVFNFIQ